jgi:tetratricopeptide (TPR) repeat protein
VTLELKETDEWTLETPNRLSFEIEGFRQVRNPAYWTPFDLSIEFQGGIEDDRFRRDVNLALSHSATSSRLFRLVPSGNATHVTITVATALTVIDVARVSQFRFPTRSGAAHAPATFVSNMLFGLAMAFQNAGRADVASQLILTFGQDAPLIKLWEWGVKAAECLASSNHVTQAVRMARALATSEPGMTAAAAVGLSGILSSRVLSPDEYEDLKSLWLLLSNQRDRASDKVFTSRAHYNLGNLLRSGGEFRSAATQYLLAARRDPIYYKRQGYFWSELGGVFFGLNKYRVAAGCYFRAMVLGEKGRTPALYADALMFSGKYSAAERRFLRFSAGAAGMDAEWVLKSQWILPFIQGVTGIREQCRKARDAMLLADVRGVSEPDEVDRRISASLRADLLSGLSWFNWGVRFSSARQHSRAAICFASAAISQPNDVQAWGCAVLSALNARDCNLATLVIASASFIHRENIAKEILAITEKQQAGIVSPEFKNWLMTLIRDAHHPDQTRTIRLTSR